MTFRRFAFAALAAAHLPAAPAFAIQEVQLGPRAPSFAAGAAPQMGFDPLALPRVAEPTSYGFGTAGVARDPASWAFAGGETMRLGSMVFNVQSGPSWQMGRSGAFDMSPLASFGPSFGRSAFDLGFTTRSTAGVFATENLMLYTTVGNTTWRPIGSAAPVAPGLQLIEGPNQRMDVRAGFKAEIMPGVVFGMEAGFAAPPTR